MTATGQDRLLAFAWQNRTVEPEAALAVTERVLRGAPNHAGAWHILALLSAARNDAKLAAHAFRRVLALEPSNLDARVAFAEVLIDLLDYKGALRELKQCVELDPKLRHPSGVRARVVLVRLQKDIQRRL